MSAKCPYGPEEPDDGERRGLVLEKQGLVEKSVLEGHLVKRPQDKDAWARNANIFMSLADLCSLESLTEAPSRACNVLVMCPG